jgi:MoxR-like ATPase
MNNLESRLNEIRNKIFSMQDYISISYYVNHPNMQVGQNLCNDVALFSIMTALLNRNQLTLGNYGLGKTTTAEAVSSLVYQLPIEFVERGMIQGHPQLTEEKIVGRLDFSKLNEAEKVIFSIFAQTPSAKIIDEINRIPEGTQNLLLRSVENGQFQYLNEVIRNPQKLPFFATANYNDGGNTSLLPPLLDRFDISVEVSFPLFLQSYLQGGLSLFGLSKDDASRVVSLKKKYLSDVLSCSSDADRKKALDGFMKSANEIIGREPINIIRGRLSSNSIANEMQDLIVDKSIPYEDKIKKLREKSLNFAEQIEGMSIAEDERQAIPYIIAGISYSADARLLADAFFDHLNSSQKSGKNNNHDTNYVSGKVDNNIGLRASMRSVYDYSRLLSFLKGENEVSAETVQEVLPYVIRHRLEFEDSFMVQANNFASSSMQMNAAKQLVKEFVEDDFMKNKDKYREMYDALGTGKIKGVVAKNKDSDNPLIKAITRIYPEKE